MRVVDFLTPYEDREVLDELDVELARGLLRMIGRTVDQEPLVALGAALASRAPGYGHLCVTLSEVDRIPVVPEPREGVPAKTLPPLPAWPEAEAWSRALEASPLVRGAGEERPSPLVLDDEGRLYLDRYLGYELRLADGIRARLDGTLEVGDPASLRGVLEQLIVQDKDGEGARRGVLDQRFAALVALRRRFAILTGGPGTGKTTSVAAILLVLLRQAEQAGRGPATERPFRIRLMAPTGKAAARMTQSIDRYAKRLAKPIAEGRVDPALVAMMEVLPLEASTIHRALGANPEKPTHFRYNQRNPLPVDAVVLDEASMVDAGTMARLLDALPDEARLILLGDQDQLASVEAGSILGDLCGLGGTRGSGVSAALADLGHRVVAPDLPIPIDANPPSIADSVARLSHPFRFDETSGIGNFSRAIRDLGTQEGEALEAGVGSALKVLQDATGVDKTDLSWIAMAEGDDLQGKVGARDDEGRMARIKAVRDLIRSRWTAVLSMALDGVRKAEDDPGFAKAVSAALTALDGFRVLCTNRRGPRGVETLNKLIRAWLEGVVATKGDWYEGRPIMVRENDYRLNLFNGDIGLVLRAGPGQEKKLMAWFPGREKPLPEGRLPAHETVYAMTIHKSQGSQFQEVVVLTPEKDSDFVTRELIYTGVTRAEAHAWVAGSEKVLEEALKRRVQRASGLRERLWG